MCFISCQKQTLNHIVTDVAADDTTEQIFHLLGKDEMTRSGFGVVGAL